jgi:hypothetical protein
MSYELRWSPLEKLSALEERICKRLERTGRLFAFLRRHRTELFDEQFQAELASMYSDRPRGTRPKPPALLAMVTLLQAYEQKSDAAAVEEAVFDRRWQMVLDCLGAETPPFSQGSLVDFRRRLIENDLDKRLIERSVELARATGDFGHTQLRVALDSAPLWGAGRVEDTFNLIGHALEVVIDCAAAVLGDTPESVRAAAGLQLVGGSSVKAALDIDWDDPAARSEALSSLLAEVERFKDWLREHLAEHLQAPPLVHALDLLARVIKQDLEPDPDGGGMRIRRGVAKDRRISVTDPDMRHGRKSRSRVINGYKRHIAVDLDAGLIVGVAVRPANEPEHAAAAELRSRVEKHGVVRELAIDRGYLAAGWTAELHEAGVPVLSKAWHPRNGGRFTKSDFTIDLEGAQVYCPEGESATIRRGRVARFSSKSCDPCSQRDKCTRARPGRGRSISIHAQESMLIELRRLQTTSEGREQLRGRTPVEHRLAHICRRQGRRARYVGIRKNTFDVRRVAAVENLHAADRFERAA